ncbi:uncharacterized protein L969DRAFT_95576 [Mixia osmundae IAM 14324]|uniref:ABC transporter TMD0 domain-containing protein n=1 Tax=Mixia osmundae (strain CBS 9802 / IAM 14324 / JCM 22182 / KY 12970) TaxID=764103 RepID=G7E7T8_MIXOS|nr:uncharacterized protein L969DRAFT_95576 [Mixia osmundae IAM 14324]KEI38499.1 hypothetical protein L969DRAFT_95576 [Mixia osmundae IAM 14324]GAA98898.1 hypothetical protein E5Q_05586 [Mixia osmundae IAM 14324]
MRADGKPNGIVESPYDSNLASCFDDVILIPLATWVFLPLSVIAFASVLASSSTRSTSGVSTRSKLPRWAAILYAVLVVALLAMEILEITRLSLSNNGVGLLPFSLVGVLIAFVLVVLLHVRKADIAANKRRTASTILALYWILSLAFNAVKLAEYSHISRFDPGNTKYPTSDHVVDGSVIVALLGIFMIIEALLVVLGGRQDHDVVTNDVDSEKPLH